jgi:hypothetical protein
VPQIQPVHQAKLIVASFVITDNIRSNTQPVPPAQPPPHAHATIAFPPAHQLPHNADTVQVKFQL